MSTDVWLRVKETEKSATRWALCLRKDQSHHKSGILRKFLAYMKHTSSKLRVHVVPVYIEYVCFMSASSCKRGIREFFLLLFGDAEDFVFHASAVSVW